MATPPDAPTPTATGSRVGDAGGTGGTDSTGEVDVAALAAEVRLACMRISRRVRFEQSGRPGAPDALAPHRFSVLARLESGPLPVTRLAETERVSGPSMTRTVGSLVDAGLAQRLENALDRRQVVVAITEAGRAAVADVRARRDLWMGARLAGLSEREIALLAAAAPVLSKVADA